LFFAGGNRQLAGLELLDEAAHHVGFEARHRDQHFLWPRGLDDAWKVPARAEDGDAVNGASELGPVVVDEANRVIRRAATHLPHDHFAGVACPDDQHAAALPRW
jgi:hypothetical protein